MSSSGTGSATITIEGDTTVTVTAEMGSTEGGDREMFAEDRIAGPLSSAFRTAQEFSARLHTEE